VRDPPDQVLADSSKTTRQIARDTYFGKTRTRRKDLCPDSEITQVPRFQSG
jgi:hypothetical protein